MPVATLAQAKALVRSQNQPYFQDLGLVMSQPVIALGGTVQSVSGATYENMEWARSFVFFLQCDQPCQVVLYRGVIKTAGVWTFDWGRSIGTAQNSGGTNWAVVEAVNLVTPAGAIKFELINTSAATATTTANLRVLAFGT